MKVQMFIWNENLLCDLVLLTLLTSEICSSNCCCVRVYLYTHTNFYLDFCVGNSAVKPFPYRSP